MKYSGFAASIVFFLLTSAFITPSTVRAEQKPEKPTAIMKTDDVRIGMKGYGMTVFHGTKIEPFPVEVVSVMRDFAPGRAVIWVSCTGDRMQKLGPVSGMSGSPIYLWPKGQEGEPGEGGKLIGAFAFGYSMSKACYAGIQPIEQMRDVASRATKPEEGKAKSAMGRSNPDIAQSLAKAYQLAVARESKHVKPALARLSLYQKIAENWTPESKNDAVEAKESDLTAPLPSALARLQEAGLNSPSVQPLALPVSFRSPEVAQFVAPFLADKGLKQFAVAQNMVAGQPPVEIDPRKIKIEPGSILTVPFAYGDLDFSAYGTVTDVLPDGRVLAFGHPMFAEGASNMPMGSGYVHFVQGNIISSFKVAGSGTIRGSLVRDEFAAICGRPDVEPVVTPMTCTVQFPGREVKKFNYKLVRHKQYTGMISAIMALESIYSEYEFPEKSSVRLSGKITFDDKHTIEFNTLQPEGSPYIVYWELYPLIDMVMNNPYGDAVPTNIEVNIAVEEGVQWQYLEDYKLARDTYKPGEKVKLTLHLLGDADKRSTRDVEFAIPKNLEEGTYWLTVGSVDSYLWDLYDNQPQKFHVASVADLYAAAETVSGTRNDHLYMTLTRQTGGSTLDRTTLPNLPASKRMLIAPAVGKTMSSFRDMEVQTLDFGQALSGSFNIPITIDKDAKPIPQR